MSAALPALFPTDVRYGSLSVGYNLSASLFGGTTPLVITALIGATGSTLMPAYYAMGAALVGGVAVACRKETAKQDVHLVAHPLTDLANFVERCGKLATARCGLLPFPQPIVNFYVKCCYDLRP